MQVKRTQAERSAATTRALVAAARGLFGKRGYGDVSVEEVVSLAGVSKGAFYHQFPDKRALLRAVVDHVEGEVAAEIRRLIEPIDDPSRQLARGCEVFLDRCLDPAARRIVLLDAPAILGWRELRTIDARHGLGIMITVLERGMTTGTIRRQPAAPLAHLVLGAAVEAGMLIANAKDPIAERRRVAVPLRQWLASLRTDGGQRRASMAEDRRSSRLPPRPR